jgi:hypothetical protein
METVDQCNICGLVEDKTETGCQCRKVSYSQYTLWANCPLQWKLKYIDRLREPSNINLIFGTSIHEAIQKWMEKWYTNKEKAKLFDMTEIFKDKLMELFKKELVTVNEDGTKTVLCDRATFDEYYLDGLGILEHVRKYAKDMFPEKGAELVGCEIPLSLEAVKGVKFVGFIDMVVRYPKENRIVIYDFKTSKKGWFYEKKDPKKLNQLLLYKHFYSKVFDVPTDNIEVEFIILKRKIAEDSEWIQKRVSSFAPAQGNTSVKKAVTSFEEFLTIFDKNGQPILEKLQPTPSDKACRWCMFKNRKDLCPSGVV